MVRGASVISFIVPTIGRPSLAKTLASIETQPGDEILVVGGVNPVSSHPRVRCIPCAPGGDFGHKERNFATPMARCRYIAHIDDDDVYAPGTRALMADAIQQTPGRPVIFRMQFPNGLTLWQEPVVRCGNLGTPCFLIPNRPTMMGQWASFVGGDCAFLESSKWKAEDYVWRPEVIALLGHDIGVAA
jgi:hypothetical protein